MMGRMLSFATKLTALLIAFIFLGAITQCTLLCAQPESVSACGHHHSSSQHPDSCAKPLLTGERVVSSQVAAPTFSLLPAGFVPVVKRQINFEIAAISDFSRAPRVTVLKATVLRV